MATAIHEMVLFTRLRNGVKEFTNTAREPDARLTELMAWALSQGYAVEIRKKKLTKQEATDMRDEFKAKYIRDGYIYRTRPPLS